MSVLIFSKDDTKECITTINEVYDFADEVVVVDSSSKANKKMLAIEKERRDLRKLKIFNAIPLGYVGPLYTYGERKCTCKWIMIIDTDERPNNYFKQNIRNALEKSSSHGLNVFFRSEDKRSRFAYNEYRLKLYRNGYLEYNGINHQPPLINGRVSDLGPKFKLFHDFNYITNEKKLERYFKIDAFTNRFTYQKILYLAKKRGIDLPLKIYLKLMRKQSGQELTISDYLFMQTAYMIAVYLLEFPKQSLKSIRFTMWYNKSRFRYFYQFTEKERREQLKISQDIEHNGGVIKYLGFDNDKVLDYLYSRFNGRIVSPVDFFVKLLRARHELGKTYYQQL